MDAVIIKNTYINKNGRKDVFWTLEIRRGVEYGVAVSLSEDMAERFIDDFLKHWTGEVYRHESTTEVDY